MRIPTEEFQVDGVTYRIEPGPPHPTSKEWRTVVVSEVGTGFNRVTFFRPWDQVDLDYVKFSAARDIQEAKTKKVEDDGRLGKTGDLSTLGMLARRLRRYGLTKKWLKAEADAGRLPCLRIGRRLLFDVQAVEAALLKRARESTTNDQEGRSRA